MIIIIVYNYNYIMILCFVVFVVFRVINDRRYARILQWIWANLLNFVEKLLEILQFLAGNRSSLVVLYWLAGQYPVVL